MTEPYYQDDQVTLYHGDCLEVDAWLRADVLVTDPPYGMAVVEGSNRLNKHLAIAGDGDTNARDEALQRWGSRPGLVFGTWRVEKPQGVRNCLVWDKGTDLGMGVLTTPWGLSHEEIYAIGEWPPLIPGGRVREGGTPCRSPSVIRCNKPNNASSSRVVEHPTPKPVALLERLLLKVPAGIIADPFAGSGSTLIAARNLSRKAIGVEIEERYCEVIAARLSQGCLNFQEGA
jgi:site-specific DNA-methyltransferase (adenine-specific)